jgi:hypothetical protein
MTTIAVREERTAYNAGGASDQRRATSDQSGTGNQRPAASDQSGTSNKQQTTNERLTEAQLSHLWAGQRFPASALATRHGVPLRVLHPGRAGHGAGPDFRDAIIAAPSGRVLRGDVELHVRGSDFRAHGHQRDAAYSRVMLHVVFEDDEGEDAALANGQRPPTVALAPWVRKRAQELAGWLSSPRLWREPCHDALTRLGRAHALRLLQQLGDGRFEERVAALAGALRAFGPAEALYRALLGGLGYGGDRALFERVAAQLPFRALAVLMEGLPQEQRAAAGRAALLAAAGDAPQRSAGRPANRPERRLEGLARLLVRHRALFDEPSAFDAELGPRALIAAWAASPYIGRSRAIELLVNAVLPWAAACATARGDAQAAERVRACFARLPRPARYGVLAFLETNLADADGALPLDARTQQGLLELYKTECTQGGCGRCALS